MVVKTSLLPLSGLPPSHWDRFSLFAVCAFAFSVNLGVAVIGLCKVLVVLAVVGRLYQQGWQGVRGVWSHVHAPVGWTLAALLWMSVSVLWSPVPWQDAAAAYARHAKLLWLLPVLFLLRTPVQGFWALACLVCGGMLVVVLSWLIHLGVPIPLRRAGYLPEMGQVFHSSIDQPVMMTVLVVVLFALRSKWRLALAHLPWLVPLITIVGVLAVLNVLFVSIGRTGYLVMLAACLFMAWQQPFPRLKWATIAITLVLGVVVYLTSSPVQERVAQVRSDLASFERGQVNTGQGHRLEMWRVAVVSIKDRPLIGHGLGSYPQTFRDYQGRIDGGASQPHQQYLYWWSEFGLVGFVLLVGWLWSLWQHARQLAPPMGLVMQTTLVCAMVMSLFNSTFHSYGVGEFLLVVIALLMVAGRDVAGVRSTA
jgi:O-antigen ligase